MTASKPQKQTQKSCARELSSRQEMSIQNGKESSSATTLCTSNQQNKTRIPHIHHQSLSSQTISSSKVTSSSTSIVNRPIKMLPKRSLRSRLLAKTINALAASEGNGGNHNGTNGQSINGHSISPTTLLNSTSSKSNNVIEDELFLSSRCLNQLIEPPPVAAPPPLFFFPIYPQPDREKNVSHGHLSRHGDSDDDDDLADYSYVDWLENAGNKKKRKVPSATNHSSNGTMGIATTTYTSASNGQGGSSHSNMGHGNNGHHGSDFGSKSRMSLIVLRDRELARRKKLEIAAAVLKVIRAQAEQQDSTNSSSANRKKRSPGGKLVNNSLSSSTMTSISKASLYKLPSTEFTFECKSVISERLSAMREDITLMSNQATYGCDPHYFNSGGRKNHKSMFQAGAGTDMQSNSDSMNSSHYNNRRTMAPPPPPVRRPPMRSKPRHVDEEMWICIFCEYEMIFGVKSLLGRRAIMLEEKKKKAAHNAKMNAAKNRRSNASKKSNKGLSTLTNSTTSDNHGHLPVSSHGLPMPSLHANSSAIESEYDGSDVPTPPPPLSQGKERAQVR